MTSADNGLTVWTAPSGPATWVLHPGDVDDSDQGAAPLIVTVSDVRTFLDTLRAAGLSVTATRVAYSETVSYVHADRGEVALTFRRPNAGEIPAPAAAAARSLDDPDRLDAESYRYLRDQISATMTGPDVWDTDDSESYILAEYVKWLADGRPVDADGYPARLSESVAHRPDTRAALRLVSEAFELASDRLDAPGSFGPSAHAALSQVRDALAKIREALTGPAEVASEPVRVGYPVRVLPADAESSKHSGRGRYQGSTGIVVRRGSDGWAGEGNPVPVRFGVRLDQPTSSPDDQGRIVYFRESDLTVTGEVSQDNSDPYPCADCHGRGRTKLTPLDPCIRCGGTGSDPYVNNGLSDRASAELADSIDMAAVIHDLDGTGSGAHAADCSGCAIESQDPDEPDEPHEHHFPVLRVLEDGPVIGDCACGMTFDEHNDETAGWD